MSSPTTLTVWEYYDPGAAVPLEVEAEPDGETVPADKPAEEVALYTEAEVAQRVDAAIAATKRRWMAETEAQAQARKNQIEKALRQFAAEQEAYLRTVEREVVHLAFSVSRKILQREASVDPDLMAALVRLALDRIQSGTAVSIRVPPQEVLEWMERKPLIGTRYQCEVTGDGSLQPGDCVLVTELGTAELGLESQLKLIEKGVLDLLQCRPGREVSTPGGTREVAS